MNLIEALSHAMEALRSEAEKESGTDRLHLEGLADAVEAELRIQVKKRMPEPALV